MFGVSLYAIPVAEVVIFVLSVVLMVLFARRDRPLWLPAIVGCGAILLVFVVAAILNQASAQDWGAVN